MSEPPRPQRLDTERSARDEISRQVPSTWRVYLPEWLLVYASDALGSAGVAECEGKFERDWKGRIRDEDFQVISAASNLPAVMRLRVPSMQGEWKDETLARQQAEGLPGDVRVVAAFSAQERELLDYGKRKLVS
jgi:hypothetical protein